MMIIILLLSLMHSLRNVIIINVKWRLCEINSHQKHKDVEVVVAAIRQDLAEYQYL